MFGWSQRGRAIIATFGEKIKVHLSVSDAHLSVADAHLSVSDAHLSVSDTHLSVADAHISLLVMRFFSVFAGGSSSCRGAFFGRVIGSLFGGILFERG